MAVELFFALPQIARYANDKKGDEYSADKEVEPHPQNMEIDAGGVMLVGRKQWQRNVKKEQQCIGDYAEQTDGPDIDPGQGCGCQAYRYQKIGDKGIVGAATEIKNNRQTGYVNQELNKDFNICNW